jgi:1-acyl-sn-glycerol-3-phosphate acyltransferase
MSNRVAPGGGDGAVRTPLEVEDLFWFNRRRPNAPVVACVLFLVLWGPIGLVLVLVRAIVLFCSLAFLYKAPFCIARHSRPYVRFVLFPLMGWLPWVTNRRHFTRTPNPKVIAMNHPSNFDPLWTHAFLGKCTVIAHEDFYWFFDFMARAGLVQRRIYTARYSGAEGQQRIQREIAEATADDAKQPLLVYPEGAVNPAQYGLMRFEKYCFSLGRPVVPVALRCINPWPFEYTLIHASDFADTFWLLFMPFLIWSFDVGAPMTIEPGQDDISFSKQVQRWVADKLRVPVTEHSWVAKNTFCMALDWFAVNQRTFEKGKTTVGAERRALKARAEELKGADYRVRRVRALIVLRLEELHKLEAKSGKSPYLVSSGDSHEATHGPHPASGSDAMALAAVQREIATLRLQLLQVQSERDELANRLALAQLGLARQPAVPTNPEDAAASPLARAVDSGGASPLRDDVLGGTDDGAMRVEAPLQSVTSPTSLTSPTALSPLAQALGIGPDDESVTIQVE